MLGMRSLLKQAQDVARGGPVKLVQAPPSPHAQLNAALRRVTHTNCAALPQEAIREAVCLACQNEDALALVLKHIEENVNAPASAWRRVHGALALLEALLKPSPSAGTRERSAGDLIGSAWFEAKIQDRLNALQTFQDPGDPRVGGLIRRGAASVCAAAVRYLNNPDTQISMVPSMVPDSHSDSAGSTGSSRSDSTADGKSRQSGSADIPSQRSDNGPATVIGRIDAEQRTEDTDHEAAKSLHENIRSGVRNATLALDALRHTGVNALRAPPSSHDSLSTKRFSEAMQRQEVKPGSPKPAVNDAKWLQLAWRLCCCLRCLRRHHQLPEEQVTSDSEEINRLLV